MLGNWKSIFWFWYGDSIELGVYLYLFSFDQQRLQSFKKNHLCFLFADKSENTSPIKNHCFRELNYPQFAFLYWINNGAMAVWRLKITKTFYGKTRGKAQCLTIYFVYGYLKKIKQNKVIVDFFSTHTNFCYCLIEFVFFMQLPRS